jgi:Protein of unknown function (DUF2934)
MPVSVVKRPRDTEVETASNDTDMPDMPFEQGVHDELDPDLRHRLISEAAYSLYVERGYRNGYDLDDWFEAEAQVDHTILNPDRGRFAEEELAQGAA